MARNKNLLIITCFFIFKIFGDEPKIELNFENAALDNVLKYIEDGFNIKFLPDDAVVTDKKIKGSKDVKITFKSNRPFTKTRF